MENFKIGDKVIFKKEVLDEILKNETAKSLVGVSLEVSYYNYLMNNSKNFKKLGYFEVQGIGCSDYDLYVEGLYLGKDLFEHYQENYSYKECDELTIGNYKGFISSDSVGYFLDLDSQFLKHSEACNKLKELFREDVFTSIAHKCNAISFKGSFPDFKSIKDLVNFVKELNKLLIDSNKESDLITTKNYQNNEIRFQKPKASCKRGIVPTGSTISGRKDKIAISIGHLSYQVCNC